jgi:hypothetical protein
LCFPGVQRESPGSCLLGQWEDRPIEEHIGLAAAPANGCAALEDQPHQARLAEGQSNSLLAHGRTREMQCTAAGLFCADGWAILKLKSTRPLPASTEGSLRAHNATLLDRAASLFLSLVSLLPSFFFFNLISSGLPVEFGLLEHVPEYAERVSKWTPFFAPLPLFHQGETEWCRLTRGASPTNSRISGFPSTTRST